MEYQSYIIEFAEGVGHVKSNYGTSFLTSFLTILVCEIGDKTFFLAMVMAMKYNKWIVFAGSYGALAVMTILSVIFGTVITTVISKFFTDLVVTLLFFYYGGVLLHKAYTHKQDEQENQELKEVQTQLEEMRKKFIQQNESKELEITKTEVKLQNTQNKKQINIPNKVILWQAFTMTFLAEFGDRSQIATIALSASYNIYFVTFGACLGHFLCTGGAVQIGEIISKRISEKTIHYIAGAIFILSGFITMIEMIASSYHHS